MAAVLVSLTCFMKSTLTASKVIGVMGDRTAAEDRSREVLRIALALPSATPKKVMDDLSDSLKLNHIPAQAQQSIRQILSVNLYM